MKTRMVSSATSFQRLQTSLQSPMPRLPRSNVYSTRDPANPSASVHRKRFFTPSLTLNISMRWLLESEFSVFGSHLAWLSAHWEFGGSSDTVPVTDRQTTVPSFIGSTMVNRPLPAHRSENRIEPFDRQSTTVPF